MVDLAFSSFLLIHIIFLIDRHKIRLSQLEKENWAKWSDGDKIEPVKKAEVKIVEGLGLKKLFLF